MNRRRVIVKATLALFGLLAPMTARGQELNLGTLDETSNVVQVKTGAEFGFVAGAGYAHVVPILDRQLVLSADFTVPWATFDLSDYQVRVGALVPLVRAGRWRIAGGLAPTLRGTKNDISRMTSVGTDFSVVGGFYARRWFVGAEAGFDWALSTYVAHTDLYRRAVYADARDGWYANPGANLRAGLQAGLSFGRTDVILRLGEARGIDGDPPLVPFYGTLALNTRW